MLTRTPSAVPFWLLLLVAAALWPLLPNAIAASTAKWAFTLIGTALVLTLPILALVKHPGFLPTVTAVLWLIPLLYGYFQNEPLCLLALAPLWRNLRDYLPEQAPLPGLGFLCSLLLQAAALAALTGLLALAILLASAGLLLMLHAQEPTVARRWTHAPWAALAVLITFVLLSPPAPLKVGKSQFGTVAIAKSPVLVNDGASDNAYKGVLVRPQTKTVDQKLPPPPWPQVQPLSSTVALPLEIPFSGVYWLFQEPLIRLPANAPEFAGAPADYRFHSDDTTALHLEARQTFRFRYPLRKIRSIEVRMRSTDPAADKLAVGLSLEDSQWPSAWTRLDPLSMAADQAEQTLRFDVKPGGRVEEFDTIVVRFYLGYTRRFIAPRVAINSFRFHTQP